LIACPGCYLRLKGAHIHLKRNVGLQYTYNAAWERPFDNDLHIIHFFELLDRLRQAEDFPKIGRLKKMRIAPYYGCMLAHPPILKGHNFYGLMEKIIATFGGQPLNWPYAARCCGTFLTVARPDIAAKMVTQIVNGAIETGAECIVTACAMCHMNLEVRSPKYNKIPIFHFSEIMALALELPVSETWFSRHLIDPKPLLDKKGMI
jgi:heterodisulfide reductase subunit B